MLPALAVAALVIALTLVLIVVQRSVSPSEPDSRPLPTPSFRFAPVHRKEDIEPERLVDEPLVAAHLPRHDAAQAQSPLLAERAPGVSPAPSLRGRFAPSSRRCVDELARIQADGLSA